jgi:hypothetical protein
VRIFERAHGAGKPLMAKSWYRACFSEFARAT